MLGMQRATWTGALRLLYAGLAASLVWANSSEAAGGGELPITHTSSDPVLTVGDHRFSQRDIALKRAHLAWKYPDYPEDKTKIVTYARLVHGYLLAEVLETTGYPITQTQLDAELKRIQNETKRPQKLKELRAIFGEKPGAYARIGVLPQFANRRYFYEVFPKLDEVQAARRKRAGRMLRRVEQGEFENLGQAADSGEHWGYDRFLFHPNRGFLRVPTGDNAKVDESGLTRRKKEWKTRSLNEKKAQLFRRMENKIFSKIDKGDVFEQVVEFDRNFSILRWRGWHDRENSTRLIGLLSLAKVRPHAYFWKKAKEIRVWIKDETVQKRLLELKPKFDQLKWQENPGSDSG